MSCLVFMVFFMRLSRALRRISSSSESSFSSRSTFTRRHKINHFRIRIHLEYGSGSNILVWILIRIQGFDDHMERLDQGHLHPKPGLTCPGRNSNPEASTLEKSHPDSLLIGIRNCYIWARDNQKIYKIYSWKKWNFFRSRTTVQITYPSLKDVQVTEEAFSFQKRTSSTSKHEISKFFSTLWVIFALLDPDSETDPDPDPLTWLNPDPTRIGIRIRNTESLARYFQKKCKNEKASVSDPHLFIADPYQTFLA